MLSQRVPVRFPTIILTGEAVAPEIAPSIGVLVAINVTVPRFAGFHVHVVE